MNKLASEEVKHAIRCEDCHALFVPTPSLQTICEDCAGTPTAKIEDVPGKEPKP